MPSNRDAVRVVHAQLHEPPSLEGFECDGERRAPGRHLSLARHAAEHLELVVHEVVILRAGHSMPRASRMQSSITGASLRRASSSPLPIHASQ